MLKRHEKPLPFYREGVFINQILRELIMRFSKLLAAVLTLTMEKILPLQQVQKKLFNFCCTIFIKSLECSVNKIKSLDLQTYGYHYQDKLSGDKHLEIVLDKKMPPIKGAFLRTNI